MYNNKNNTSISFCTFENIKVKFAKVQKCEVKTRVTFYDFLVPKIWLCGNK